MLTRLRNQLLSIWKGRSQRLKSFGLLFVFGVGLSVAIATFITIDAGYANPPKQLAQANQLTVLKMANQKGVALLNILKAQGTLEKRLKPRGISVSWNEFSSTAPLLDAMGAGAVVFGAGGGTGSVFAQAGDKPFVRVAASINTGTRGSPILVKENSPIKTLRDLKGKKVGFAKGSGQHYIIVHALQKVGLTYNDIKPVFLTPAEALVAFDRGDIDAWLIWDPYTAQAEQKIRTRVLADNGTIFGDKAATENPGFYYAAPDFVRNHQDILKIILQEVDKAAAWSNKNTKASAKLLSDLYKIDLKTMEIVEGRSGTRKIVQVNDEALSGLQRMADTFYDLKIIPKKINVKDKQYNWLPAQRW